jgi:hypothetical protein
MSWRWRAVAARITKDWEASEEKGRGLCQGIACNSCNNSCAGQFCFQLELQPFYSFTVLANRVMVDKVGQRDWKSAYARILPESWSDLKIVIFAKATRNVYKAWCLWHTDPFSLMFNCSTSYSEQQWRWNVCTTSARRLHSGLPVTLLSYL